MPPTSVRFCRYQLLTTDVAAARAFYAAVLGQDRGDIVPLPEAALARGAPAHWLGHVGVGDSDDVEAAVRAFEGRGATCLSPTRPTSDGGEFAIVRDPDGAVLAVATRPSADERADVVWHQLHAIDLPRAIATYGEIFGWEVTRHVDLRTFDVHQEFAWHVGGAAVGSMAETAKLPGIHPHWLFHFRVPALELALVAVRAGGTVVFGPTIVPGGHRIAVCDDPQGAAFALRECPPETSVAVVD